MNFRNGFYIEAGANDGITQSNTKYLQDALGWKGLLVEPSATAFDKLMSNRPGNFYRNACLVSENFSNKTIKGDFDGSLMSSVDGVRRNSDPKSVNEVECARLGDILDDLKVEKVDFLSLDTEGYELEVLKGLNINKHHPSFILVEVYKTQKREVFRFLNSHHYRLIECISNFNKRDNPNWDGTHNDYLFKYDPTYKPGWLRSLLPW
jgi:FkbM family methyltransferase